MVSYVRFSTKVVQPCPVCHDEGWVALLPQYPDWLTWRGHTEGGDRRDPMPHCCTSCWYIYGSDHGLEIWHAGGHVCSGPNGETFDHESFMEVEDADLWEPPKWCRHRDVALEAVAEWIAEEEDRIAAEDAEDDEDDD